MSKKNGKYYKNIAKILKLYNKMTKAIVIITKKLYNIYSRLTCEGIRLGSRMGVDILATIYLESFAPGVSCFSFSQLIFVSNF